MIGIYIHITESQNLGELKGGEASLLNIFPPPFIREGDKGGGLINI